MDTVAALLFHPSVKVRAKTLLALSESDENHIVRIHAAGAVRAMEKALGKIENI